MHVHKDLIFHHTPLTLEVFPPTLVFGCQGFMRKKDVSAGSLPTISIYFLQGEHDYLDLLRVCEQEFDISCSFWWFGNLWAASWRDATDSGMIVRSSRGSFLHRVAFWLCIIKGFFKMKQPIFHFLRNSLSNYVIHIIQKLIPSLYSEVNSY